MSNEGFGLQRVAAQDEETIARQNYPDGYLRPDGYADGYGYGQSYSTEGEQDSTKILREILHSARKHKWLIAAITIIVTPIIFVEASRFRPTFTAFTDLEIRRDSSVMATPGTDSDPQNIIIINTKKLMFDSRPLLADVVEKNRLNEDPRFLDVALKRSRLETIKSLFGLNAPDPQAQVQSGHSTGSDTPAQPVAGSKALSEKESLDEVELDRYIGIIKGRKKIDQLPNTQALRVSFTHTDPEIARIVADGLTESFIQNNLDAKLDKFKATSQFLDTAIGQLSIQVQQAEQELNRFTREKGLFSSDEPGEDTLAVTRLRRLQDQIGQLDRELLTKELLYNEVQQNRASQLPQALSDLRIARFQASLDTLLQEEVKLSLDLGDDHPDMKRVREQIEQTRKQLEISVKELEHRIKIDYERTKSEKDRLSAQLEKTSSEALEKDQAAIGFSLLKQKLENTKSAYLNFLQKKQQMGLEAAQQRSNIIVLRPAELPKSPDGVDPFSSTLLGFGAALLGSIGLAFLIDRFDTTIKSRGDVTRYTHLPTLGLIPAIEGGTARRLLSSGKKTSDDAAVRSDSSNGKHEGFSLRFLRSFNSGSVSESLESGTDRVILIDDRSPIAEAYRVLRTSVLLSAGGNPPKTMLFTSGQPGEGKTTTAINTAISLAHLGASVLIIDADLRKPSTHRGFNIKQSHGLSTYLSRDAEIDGLIQKLHIPNLSLLPCGPIPSNPAELISSDKMKEMLRQLGGRYDHILIDSPPLMYVTDPVVLSTMVDGVVLVVHGGRSTREAVRLSRQMLDNVGARVFGVVLNNIKPTKQSPYDFAYYKYYSSYDANQKQEERVSDILNGM